MSLGDGGALGKFVAELRNRVVTGGGWTEVSSAELERLISAGGIQAIIDHPLNQPEKKP